jgi:transcriptional regulator with XRE-family HTH domain
MTVFQAIRALRKHIGESQQAFSNRLGMSMSAIVKYEAGKGRSPEASSLVALAHVALEVGRSDVAQIFADQLIWQLGLKRIQDGKLKAAIMAAFESIGICTLEQKTVRTVRTVDPYLPTDRGITRDTAPRWLTTEEAARLLGLHPGTLRTWRSQDMREKRGTPDRPGRGNLIWRKFGAVARYWSPSIAQYRADDERRSWPRHDMKGKE